MFIPKEILTFLLGALVTMIVLYLYGKGCEKKDEKNKKTD